MMSRRWLALVGVASALFAVACGNTSPSDPSDPSNTTADDDDVSANDATISSTGDGSTSRPDQDGSQGSTETDLGCGGASAPPCADGKKCLVNADCTSIRCVDNRCQVPSSNDATKNGTETDVDCGGAGNPKCDPQKACGAASDCTSGVCFSNLCATPSSSDNVKNGTETDVDCGGASAPACDTGKACADTTDCLSVVCIGKVCQAPAANDGTKNGTETDIDCGGGAPTNAPKCLATKSCALASDCDQGVCTGNICQAPTKTDAVKNGSETDVDCGGGAPTNAPKCVAGLACTAATDCDSGVCTGKKCQTPTKTDNVQNGTETDIDCGGIGQTNAPKCAIGKKCLEPTDCSSDGCDYKNKCVERPSCTVHMGGDTCGRGETDKNGVDEAGAVHESCCASAALPSNPNVLMGKYEITAGRMREFIRRTGGDVRTYIDAHPTSQIRTADKVYLPQGLSTPANITYRHCDANGGNCVTDSRNFGVYDHLGNTTFFADRPCPNCGQGCFLGKLSDFAYGHPTYHWDDTTQASQWSAQPRKFSQPELDVKSLNCVTQLLLAAFCKWDGGRLPTEAELAGNSASSAWGTNTYPWGTAAYTDTLTAGSPGRVVYPAQAGAFLVPASFNDGASNLADAVAYNTTNWNPFGSTLKYFRYVYPVMPSVNWDQTDQAFAIAAPGRMYNDRRDLGAGTLNGYFDVAGNIMETTGDLKSLDNADHASLPQVRWVGGSFEGHNVNRNSGEKNILTKYGKMGGRCVYDKP